MAFGLVMQALMAWLALTQRPDWPSAAVTGGVYAYEVAEGDSLTSVGARFGIEPRTLARDNGLRRDAWLHTGAALTVDTRHIAPSPVADGVVLNVAQRMLFVFVSGKLVRAFPVAVGRPDWPTPQGRFEILVKEKRVMIEFKRILCAVDFSEFSQRALDHALSVARGYGSTVTALHIVAPAPTAMVGAYFGSEMAPPILLPTMDRETATRELERLVTAEGVPGVTVETVVAEAAETYRGILTESVQLQSDLLVMGTHGRSGFERLFLGSTAEKVLRKAGCPVMTVPPKAPDAMPRGAAPFSGIVCGVDFSTCSRMALDYATSLAQQNAAALAVVHGIDTHPLYVDFAPPAAIDLHAWTQEATSRLHRLVPDDVRATCRITEFVREGAPYQEILRLSQELAADLIVLGVRGRRAADLMFFGSTTHRVIREAGCAVLTLRN